MAGASLLLIIAIPAAIFGALILVSSAFRHTSPRAGFVALGWTVLIWLVAGLASAVVAPSASNGVVYLVGTVLTVILAQRAKYVWGLSWLFFILGPFGWFIILWRANNQSDARKAMAALPTQA